MKITKYFLSMAAALGMIAGCQKPDMVQIAAPEDVVAPVLEAVEGPIEITPSNMVDGKVAFTWSLADYGVMTQVNYSLEAATAANPDTKVTITSGITANAAAIEAGKISSEIEYEALNAILFNDLKLNDGVAEEVLFTIASKVGEYAPVYSNSVAVSCKVTAAEKQYPKLTVAGSYAYNNWTPGKGQFVFDFEGTDAKYSGVIDFGEDVSALQFKFVGEAWGNNEFSVPAGETQAPEAAELPLVAGGGDNISAYTTHRFYSLTLDKNTPKVIKNFSFNSLGVIGDATPTGWDADTDMQFNADKQRFYVDLTLIDGTIKFRADDAWDVNWGGADGVLVANGDNVAVSAGDYRIYVNLNDPANPTYELNKGMFGKEEPVGGNTTPEPEPEPTPVVGWGLVGEYNGWGAEADVMLASDGTFLTAKGVALSGQVKFRKDGGWDVNFGAPGEVEPVEIAVNTELELVANGKNFTIAEGTYDVYLDEANAKAWFINDGSYPGGGAAPELSTWALIGDFNSWGSDYPMFIEGEYHVAKGFVVATEGGMKFRKDAMWNYKDDNGNEIQTNLGGTFAVNAELDLVGNGSNLTVPAGTYDVYLKVAEDGQSGKAYFMTDGKTPSDAGAAPEPEPEPEPDPTELTWYLVGDFNGWTVADAAYTMTKEAEWFVFKGFVADGDGFKFNAGSWDINRGATGDVEPFELAANTEYEIVANGKNFSIAAGTYDVYMSLDAAKVYVMAEGLTPGQTPGEEPEEPEFEGVQSIYGVIGVNNDWTNDIMMYTTPVENLFVARDVVFTADGGFKVRKAGAWDDTANFGLENGKAAVVVDHVYNVITSGGSGDLLVTAGAYDIWFDLQNMKIYVMTPGKDISEATPGEGVVPEPVEGEPWYLVGNFNGWSPADANYKMTFDGTWYVFKNFAADGKGMKFVGDSNWSRERVGTFKSANTAISVAKGSGDMFPTAGTYDVYLSADAKTAYFMTPGTTPAN